ncbi:MAG: hypothetical protein HS111_40875, partial [Kofleriaceae bacterium]|nr:hypothetical protein [Kofleriaceae bacterium]
ELLELAAAALDDADHDELLEQADVDLDQQLLPDGAWVSLWLERLSDADLDRTLAWLEREAG